MDTFQTKMADARIETAARLAKMAAEYRALGDDVSARNCDVAAARSLRMAQDLLAGRTLT